MSIFGVQIKPSNLVGYRFNKSGYDWKSPEAEGKNYWQDAHCGGLGDIKRSLKIDPVNRFQSDKTTVVACNDFGLLTVKLTMILPVLISYTSHYRVGDYPSPAPSKDDMFSDRLPPTQ